MSPTKLPSRKALYAVSRPQHLRKIRASQRFSNCLIFSNRLTPNGSYPVRVANSPTILPARKALYAVHRPQNLRKIRASQRFSNCLTPNGSYPGARRQFTYETPCPEGPVRSASPAEPEENTSEPAILKLSHILKPSHAERLIPRARRHVTYETPCPEGPIRSEPPAAPEENTSKRFSNRLIFSNRLTPARPSSPPMPDGRLSLTTIGLCHRLPRA